VLTSSGWSTDTVRSDNELLRDAYGIGLDRSEHDATITNRGHAHPRNDLQPTARNATMSRDTC
jgi:hypothetical protein